MSAMIAEDIAVVVVIALFIWLVPMRRNGIPGLRGRGRAPGRTLPGHTEPGRVQPGSEGMAGSESLQPRPVPANEQITASGERSDSGQRRRVPSQHRDHQNSA